MPVMNDNKPNNMNATALRPWRCFQSKRNPFISLERAFDLIIKIGLKFKLIALRTF